MLGAEILVGRLNRRLVGWANYFCLGPVSKAYRAVDRHVTTRLRRWLREKHKTPRVGTTRFPDEYLYHTLGLVRLPRLTRNLPWANARTSLSESRMREIRPVRFDEREVETEPPSHRAASYNGHYRDTVYHPLVASYSVAGNYDSMQHGPLFASC